MDVNLMNSANTHYTRTAQILHWLMAIIFVIISVCASLGHGGPVAPLQDLLYVIPC
jgi:cytochrome b561